MAVTHLFLELGGREVGAEELASVAELSVEEATYEADALTMTVALAPTDAGEWTGLLDAVAAPKARIVAEFTRGAGSYRFDGVAAEAEWKIDAEGGSRLTVKAVDRSLEMDAVEKVTAWPGSADSVIAQAVFASYGMATEVDDTPAGPDPDVHVAFQRGTDWAFLRALADKWGFAVYLESSGDKVVGHFHAVDPLAPPQTVLALGFGDDAHEATVTAKLATGHRVEAVRVPPLSTAAVAGGDAGTDQAQGALSLGGLTTVLLAPEDVWGEADAGPAARSLALRSAYAVTLTTTVDTDTTGVLLRARRPVLVKGLGNVLSGRYLVDKVRHVVSPDRHMQELTLVRNALGTTGDEPWGGGLAGLVGLGV
ncbi:hypothetical protein [Yinghuangia seranimata]|uniref:hypothetical protein n=1 Tax=Yinghuangia seranimata TaxID=408067 RepID=UPI00248D2AA7|nr:hypothetical protein [Yinghuangia seranimata]MDI2131688.1 hypothetical protein [Yinghuangia seranimata]